MRTRCKALLKENTFGERKRCKAKACKDEKFCKRHLPSQIYTKLTENFKDSYSLSLSEREKITNCAKNGCDRERRGISDFCKIHEQYIYIGGTNFNLWY